MPNFALNLFENEATLKDTLRYMEQRLMAGIYFWDVGTPYLNWSRGVYELFGFLPGSVNPTFDLVQEMTHPDDRRPPGSIEHSIQNGLPFEREMRIIWKNGRLRWVHSRSEVLMSVEGKPVRMIGVVVDTTAIHEEKKNAAISEMRRQHLLAATGGFPWTADAAGNMTSISRPDGMPCDSPARDWIASIHEDDRATTLGAWKLAVATGTKYIVEHRISQPDGAYRWHRSQATPITNDDGVVLEWAGITLDVHTERTGLIVEGQTFQITGDQIRGGRGLLNWSVKELADTAKISPSTVRRLEEFSPGGAEDDLALNEIEAAMKNAGVDFLFLPEGKPGIRLR